MARGVRSFATVLSPNLQPQSASSYDPITRRNTILVANIVPTVNLAEVGKGVFYTSDRYYSLIGAASTSTNLGMFFNEVATEVTLQQWDTTRKVWYARLATAAAGATIGNATIFPVIHYLGPFGASSSYAPKNAAVTAVNIQFTARFNTNADYTTYGVGAKYGATGNVFQNSADYFIQVLRNTTAWELGTCDGTTISQSSGGTGDGNWHEFKVTWNATNVRLFVDGTLTITKSTNVPNRSLCAMAFAQNSTDTIDIVDYLISWE